MLSEKSQTPKCKNYNENANIVTKKTLGAKRQTAKREDEIFEGDEDILYIDCSYHFIGICIHQSLSDYALKRCAY